MLAVVAAAAAEAVVVVATMAAMVVKVAVIVVVVVVVVVVVLDPITENLKLHKSRLLCCTQTSLSSQRCKLSNAYNDAKNL